MASPSDCSMGARIGFAVLGIIIGVSITIVFAAEYHNYNASIWGFVSGVAAAFTLFVHVTFTKRWYGDDPYPLRQYMYCGCFFQMVGLCGFVVYIVLAIYDKQGLIIYGNGYYLTSVWCFMTLKWGFQLFFFSRSYWRRLTGASKPLLHEEKSYQATVNADYGIKS